MLQIENIEYTDLCRNTIQGQYILEYSQEIQDSLNQLMNRIVLDWDKMNPDNLYVNCIEHYTKEDLLDEHNIDVTKEDFGYEINDKLGVYYLGYDKDDDVYVVLR